MLDEFETWLIRLDLKTLLGSSSRSNAWYLIGDWNQSALPDTGTRLNSRFPSLMLLDGRLCMAGVACLARLDSSISNWWCDVIHEMYVFLSI